VSPAPPHIQVILASTRPGRFGEKPAAWLMDRLSTRTDLMAELIDLRDFPLPMFDQPASPARTLRDYPNEQIARWGRTIDRADGYIVVTPEYNHGYPGNLKNAIDHVHTGWFYKPIAFVSYGGNAGCARAVEQLRAVACELRMVPVRGEVNVRLIGVQLDESGHPTDPYYMRTANAMLDQLLWWARAIKHARAAEAPPA
jgi:NAD(P)H-dependent FMN reductase